MGGSFQEAPSVQIAVSIQSADQTTIQRRRPDHHSAAQTRPPFSGADQTTIQRRRPDHHSAVSRADHHLAVHHYPDVGGRPDSAPIVITISTTNHQQQREASSHRALQR